MLNLIRMNLFRLVHTKSAVVVFAVLMGFSVLSGCMSAYDIEEQVKIVKEQKEAGIQDEKREMTKEEEEAIQKKAEEEEAAKAEEAADENSAAYDAGYEYGSQMSANIGIYISTPVDSDGNIKDYLYLYCEELGSGLLLLFILIGAVLFFRGDEKYGFLKNIAGQTKHRYNIFLSKLLVTGIYTFACMVCYMVVEFVALKCSLLTGTGISFGVKYIPEALKVFVLEYLLYMAFISGLLLITEVTKSTAAAITMGLLGILGFGIFFSALVQKVFHTDFNIARYYISTSISNLYLGMDWETINFALGIGICFVVMYNVLNTLWFIRKDIV